MIKLFKNLNNVLKMILTSNMIAIYRWDLLMEVKEIKQNK
jgi:hypothetical protein